MLYYNFDGYEGFCCRFGFIEHDNGKKTRRNRILLDFIKDRNLLRKAIRTNNFSLLNITNMADLKRIMFEKIMDSGEDDGIIREYITGKRYHLPTGMLRSGLAGFFSFITTEGKPLIRG